jgi:hypothetical protein
VISLTPDLTGLYVTGDPGGVDEHAQVGQLVIRIGLLRLIRRPGPATRAAGRPGSATSCGESFIN